MYGQCIIDYEGWVGRPVKIQITQNGCNTVEIFICIGSQNMPHFVSVIDGIHRCYSKVSMWFCIINPMTWKLNVDGIHDLKPIQNKDCVLGVLRSKTKNILSPGVKLMPTDVTFYIQRLDLSTENFRILVTTNNLYFSCPAKTGRY